MAEAKRLVIPCRRTLFARTVLPGLLLFVFAQVPLHAWAAQTASSGDSDPPLSGADRHPPAIGWSTLDPREQQVLAALRTQWASLPATQQQRLRRIAQRWQDAPPVRRTAIEARLSTWAAMTPEQRAASGSRFQQFRRLAPEQQQDLRDAYQRFNTLPPDQRKALREQFETMSPTERAAFVDGTHVAERADAWRRFIADVPAAERPALRTMWFSLVRPQRHALRRHLRSLSAVERADLRTRLLAMTPDQRNAFIAALPRTPAEAPPVR